MDLAAVFRVRDQGTSQLRRITQMMNQVNLASRVTSETMNQSQQAINRVTRATTTATTAMNQSQHATSRVGAALRTTNSSINSFVQNTRYASNSSSTFTSSLGGMKGALLGLVGAYLGANAAAKAFDSTIGAAARFEQQEVVTKTMFQDDGKATSYMKLMEKMALDSAVLNSGDMMTGSKAFVGLTKDLNQLEAMWKVTEKLQAFSGVDTGQASFSFKELLQGDAVSIVEAIGMDKKSMQSIAKLGTVEQKIAAITKELDKMGVTDETLKAMSETTLGRWSAITEKVQSFFKAIGSSPNGQLNDYLATVQNKLEGIDMTSLADKIGGGLTNAFNLAAGAIDFVKTNIDDFKATIGFVKEAVIGLGAAFIAHKAIVGAMTIYSTITTLMTAYRAGTLLTTAATLGFNAALWANPVTWVVGAIAGLIGIGVLLYRNWDVVTAKTKEVWSAIGGLKGGIALVLGPIGFLINAGIDLAKNWDSTKSVWTSVWSAIQRSAASSVNAVIGLINEMIVTINKIPGVNIPIVAKVNWGATKEMLAAKATSNRGMIPGHYHGLNNVPYDNYLSYLHKGEMVLPRFEAEAYRRKSGVDDVSYNEVSTGNTYKSTTNQYSTTNTTNGRQGTPVNLTVNFNGDQVVNGEVDHEKIAYTIAREVERLVAFR